MGEKCNFRTLHPLRFQIEVRTVLICYVPIRAWKLVSKMLMILNKNPGFGHPNNFYHSAGRIFPVPKNIQYFPIFWGSFPRTLLSRFANRNTPESIKTGVRKDAKMYTTPFVKFQNRNWFIFWIWSSEYEPLRCLKSWSEPLRIGFWKIRDDKLRHFDRVMTYFSGPMGTRFSRIIANEHYPNLYWKLRMMEVPDGGDLIWGADLRIGCVAVGSKRLVATVSIHKWRFQSREESICE